MEYKIFVDYSSVGKLGTTIASINCTGKSNAAKGIENHYNKYRKFHLRETEAHVVAPFMEMMDMKKKKSELFQYQSAMHQYLPQKSSNSRVHLTHPWLHYFTSKNYHKGKTSKLCRFSKTTAGTTVDSDYELAETLHAQFQILILFLSC